MHVFTVPFSSCAFVLLACLATAGGASATQQPRSQAAPASAGDPVTQEVPFPTAGDAYYSAGRGGAGTIPTGGQTADLFYGGGLREVLDLQRADGCPSPASPRTGPLPIT